MSHISERLLTEKNSTYRCMCVRFVVSHEIQITVHKEHGRSSSAAVRGLLMVFHREILTCRSATSLLNRGVCMSSFIEV